MKMKIWMGLLLVLSWMALAISPEGGQLSAVSPANGSLISGDVEFLSLVTYGIDDTEIVRMDVTLIDENGARTTLGVDSTSPMQTEFVVEVDTATLSDGVYSAEFNATNGTGVQSGNASFSNVLTDLVVDNTPPTIENLLLGELSSGSYLNKETALGFIPFRTIVNDTNGVSGVLFTLTNSSGSVAISPEVNGSEYVALLDISLFSDGNYTITVEANDTAGNIAETEFLFGIDRGKPSVSVSCNPSEVAEGVRVNCECMASDSGSGLNPNWGFTLEGLPHEEGTTAASPGEYESSICRAVDLAGNSNEVKGTWKVIAQSSGGGGAGGSGGGVSSRVQGQLEKKTWASILKGEEASVKLKNGALAVTEVSFLVDKNTYGVTIEVKKLDKEPTNTPKFGKKVYKYLDLKQTNLKNLDGLITISFKVDKNWFTAKGLSSDKVALFHFEDGKWVELESTMSKQDKEYVYYEAKSKSLSPFIIGERTLKESLPVKGGSGVPEPPEEEVTEEPLVEDVIPVVEEEPIQEESKIDWGIVGIFVLVVVVILGLWYWFSKQKEDEELPQTVKKNGNSTKK